MCQIQAGKLRTSARRPPPGRAIPISPQPPLTAAAAAARAAEEEQAWEDLNEPEPVTKQSFVDVSLPFPRRVGRLSFCAHALAASSAPDPRVSRLGCAVVQFIAGDRSARRASRRRRVPG
jgi:hypothetical protein